jgi:hypothetical protein
MPEIPIVMPILIGLEEARYFPESDLYCGGAEERAYADPRNSGFRRNL